jgi:hypothetical protein|tara:strand:- start:748 stop:921 length:174 start_codon:yes stop_codon:yes gene_type:complete
MYPTHLQKTKYRVTLDFDVFEDFDPYNINFNKLFEIEGEEKLDVYIEKEEYEFNDIW